ncbi:fatty acyl-CoA reductase 1 [Caerostris darwini]|uniref:Fatty acyl-CoA reductase n=1 Tax=Caerostris darwini TaxID=1538125 RepID=A0AAV4RWT9_9ARAC|nr:fatty acyl-CoA reductase 1 [Caerostris darwini]
MSLHIMRFPKPRGNTCDDASGKCGKIAQGQSLHIKALEPFARCHTMPQIPQVADFYEGKSILLTGASGYLGVILLETLLRCFPGIRSIYILLREKRGVQPECRKEQIFKKKIFTKLKEKQTGVLKKVHVIAGDVTLPRIGMSQVDFLKVIQEVTIVFHVAASISFMKPLRFMLKHNAKALDYVIDLCKELKKIDVLVYTSTAYSNCNRQEVEEQIYRLPFPAQRFLDELNKDTDDGLNYLATQCLPKWPNNYTFSKCLSENILLEKATEFPTAIIRPSIIISCWKGIMPGYIEEGSGMVDLGLAIGKGFVRVLRGNPGVKIDIIPVDVVANAHIAAAWSVAAKRSSSPLVVNCTSSDVSECTLHDYTSTLFNMTMKHPLPKSYQKQSITIQKNFVLYWLFSLFEHYAPAIVIDAILNISGRKPKLLSLYRFYEKAMDSLLYFLTNEWNFHTQNLKQLERQLNPEEKENLYLDLQGFSVNEMARTLPEGAPFYEWEIDPKRIAERKRVTHLRYMLTSCIKAVVLALVFSAIYIILFPFYQAVTAH